MVKFKREVDGILFDINLMNKVNVLSGESASGKTYLLNVLRGNTDVDYKDCIKLNYEAASLSDETIIQACKDKKLVLLDNADLYITHELGNKIFEVCEAVVISAHSTVEIPYYEDSGVYVVDYDGKILKTRKTGVCL